MAGATVSQAVFAWLTEVTPRQVSKWARGRAPTPLWAVILAVLLQDCAPDALMIAVEGARQSVSQAKQVAW